MVEIKDFGKFAQMVEDVEFARNFNKKAKREIRKQRIAEMVANGVDKEMAAVMVDAFIACGL